METPNALKTLILANGDVNDGPLVRQALAAAPDAWVIAADGGARLARFWGLPVHTLIGDMDSLPAAEVTALAESGTEVQRYPEEKNETDLELAFIRAAGQGAVWIRVLGAVGDRLDQTLSNVYLLALPALVGRDVRLLAGKQEIWLLHPGESVIQGAAGDTVSLIPLNGDVSGVRTENLYYALRDETLVFGPARGISNVMQAGTARVWIREGILLVVHTLGRA
ncbi:MAG: thiamine diphosphokinase [Chloroflexi bacterium]|nr:thiamine diphosphokinase [Chloroflexota bacterium]